MPWPTVVLLAVWYTRPARALGGMVGLLLFVWSVWPVGDDVDAGPHSTRINPVFWVQAGKVWKASPMRGTAAVAGVLLIAWSLWAVTTMR